MRPKIEANKAGGGKLDRSAPTAPGMKGAVEEIGHKTRSRGDASRWSEEREDEEKRRRGRGMILDPIMDDR